MSEIIIRGARLHNLKNISFSIPKNQLVVFSGLSGSGKSTMAFDTLHKEGQRQYMESLGMVTYESRPPVDAIVGLSPSISVDQQSRNHSPRSTVGTATEVYTYLRVLFARTGHRPCPECGTDVPPEHRMDKPPQSMWDYDDEASDPENTITCPYCGAALPEMGMAFFSFNKPAGACPACTGLGTVYTPNLPLILDEKKSLIDGAVLLWVQPNTSRQIDILRAASRHYGFKFDPSIPVRDFSPALRDLLLYGVESPSFCSHYPNIKAPTIVARGHFEGVVSNLLRRHGEHASDSDSDYLEKLENLLVLETCHVCAGTRLRPEAGVVNVAGRSIVEITQMPLSNLAEWINGLQATLSAEDWLIGEPIVVDLQERVRRLVEIGLGYLTLERSTPSLSAGEAHRLRMAALLSSGLTGVLYVLDEPSIGLHARDNLRLVKTLRALRDLGNTVLVIEHDLDMIAAADWVVDFGPGAGRQGGQIVAQGTPSTVAQNPASITGQYLAGRAHIPVPADRRPITGEGLTIHGAHEHNLKNITVFFPQHTLTAITGVSGSGKSSLMIDILDRAAHQRFYSLPELPGVYESIDGWENFDKIITIDQNPIGRSNRSNAVTYTDAYAAIREVFAAQPAASEHGLTAQHFSFNLPGGRCNRCNGAGILSIEMHFLPNVQVRCPTCHGRRFKPDVLAVKYKGYDIAQVFDLTIEEAVLLFDEVPATKARLGLMVETGMGYLQLGQSASTFSGGEAQRVKLAKELVHHSNGRTLYLLDEPTTGLHAADTVHLLLILQRLVDAGNTVIVVEHNLDMVKCADWVIDLGPEGGEAGGQIIAEGTPETIAANPQSITGQMLKRLL
ncbi:MAG: excinuclease ABC subunit UvrA [Chloroflexota bacterium]